jgi:hypothetical protein
MIDINALTHYLTNGFQSIIFTIVVVLIATTIFVLTRGGK